MNDGVFCKKESSKGVYNSILIDEYHKCIFRNGKIVAEQGNTMDVRASSSTEVTEEQSKWETGMNVRAPYFVDDKPQYYEAKILKIFDEKFAVIEFFGYDEEHVVKLCELENSAGKEAIEEQRLNAKEEYDNVDGDDEDDDEEELEIDWQVGMPCRAYYEPMDVIYEATIEKVDLSNRTAFVSMIGYDTTFTVSFNHLYKSDPSLREKQAKSAQKYKAKVQSDLGDHGSPPNGLRSHEDTNPSVGSGKLNKSGQCKFESQPHQSKCALNSSFQCDQERSVMKPKDENEALACLVSANYLAGYYAGYFDCLKNIPMRNERDLSKNHRMYTRSFPNKI